MAANSHGVIYAAIACNLGVSVIKFVVAAATGSSAMLARKCSGLLVDESVDREQILYLQKIISTDAAVENVGQLLTMQSGQDNVLLSAAVRYGRHLKLDQVERAIKKKYSAIRHLFLESGALKAPPREAS